MAEDDGVEAGGDAKGKGQTSMKITTESKPLNNDLTHKEEGKCEDKTTYVREHCFIETGGATKDMKEQVT